MATTEGFATTYDDSLPPSRPLTTAIPAELPATPVGTNPPDRWMATGHRLSSLAALRWAKTVFGRASGGRGAGAFL